MTRLTTPQGDYCRDICGQASTCERLKHARTHPEAKCGDARRYDKLRRYENTGWEPEEIKAKGAGQDESNKN